MERRNFLGFLGALVPAASLAPKELPAEKPKYSVMCNYCRKNFAASFEGTPPDPLPMMYCAECTHGNIVVNLADLEDECGKIGPNYEANGVPKVDPELRRWKGRGL